MTPISQTQPVVQASARSSAPASYNRDEMAGYLTYWLLKGAPQTSSNVSHRAWNQRLTQWLDRNGSKLHVEAWQTDDFDRLAAHMSVLRPVNDSNEMVAARGDVRGYFDREYHGQLAVFEDEMRARSISWGDRVEANATIQQYIRNYTAKIGRRGASAEPTQSVGGQRQLASTQLVRGAENPKMVI